MEQKLNTLMNRQPQKFNSDQNNSQDSQVIIYIYIYFLYFFFFFFGFKY
jgi:hypothetical protein